MARLHGRAWQGVQKYDKLESLDDVEEDPTTKLPKGVSQLLPYLQEKSGMLEAEEVGKCMRAVMKATFRKSITAMRDYLTQFK
eukprot:3374858-Pyramimonas_sp.AAC.1